MALAELIIRKCDFMKSKKIILTFLAFIVGFLSSCSIKDKNSQITYSFSINNTSNSKIEGEYSS